MDSASFDPQATRYEARTGLPAFVGEEVAAFLVASLPVGASAMIVDVGAGTGTIGRHLAGACEYVAIDASAAMLAELERSLPTDTPRDRVALHAMDANLRWPIADHMAALILFSRSLHLLDAARVVEEVVRVARPGGRVWVGRVRKPEMSAPERLRRQMQQLLRAADVEGRNGQRARREFLETLSARGATTLPRWTSKGWTIEQSARDAITAWRQKPGLGGRAIPEAMKDKILDQLEEWAAQTLGDLDAPAAVERTFEIEGVQLGPS